MSAGFEHSGHFKGYLLSLESLLVFFFKKEIINSPSPNSIKNYYFHISVHHLFTISTGKFWFSFLTDLFYAAFQKGKNMAQTHYETL